MINHKDQMDLMLYTNVALIGEITENMRAVLISRSSHRIDLRFIFFKEPNDDEMDAMGIVGTEVVSHYSEDTEFESYEIIPAGPISMRQGEVVAFKRKEEFQNEK